jgi:hypothetical protein
MQDPMLSDYTKMCQIKLIIFHVLLILDDFSLNVSLVVQFNDNSFDN